MDPAPARTPTTTPAHLPWAFLYRLKGLIGCDNLNFFGLDSGVRSDYLSQSLDDEECYFDGPSPGLPADEDPFWRHYWASSCSYPETSRDYTSVTKVSDFYSTRQLHSSGMYVDHIAVAGYEHEMMLCLPDGAGRSLRAHPPQQHLRPAGRHQPHRGGDPGTGAHRLRVLGWPIVTPDPPDLSAVTAVEAVIFDWGGTLTPWHTIDFEEESRALAGAVVDAPAGAVTAIRRAAETVWGRSRDDHVSATVADLFVEAGLTHDEDLLTAYREFWDPHTHTDPDVVPLFEALRADGLKVGVLSNTVWPRSWHEEFFERDGVLGLIDGAVYTSEIPWTKPAPEAFRAAMAAIDVEDAARCAFVGDRLFDDIWGAGNVGMRTVLVPHSDIPPTQFGHSEGTPDAVVQRLAQVYDVVAGWRA